MLLKCLTDYLFDRSQHVVFHQIFSLLIPVFHKDQFWVLVVPDLHSLTLSRAGKLNMFADGGFLYKDISTIEDF